MSTPKVRESSDSISLLGFGCSEGLGPLPERTLAEIHNPHTGERELSETGAAYYGSHWRVVRKLYVADDMRAYALREVQKTVQAVQAMLSREAEEPGSPGIARATVELGPTPRLVGCPLCGAENGYTLSEGSTHRWWRMACADCGRELGECRSDNRMLLGGILPDRWESADDAWNEAGAYAQRLQQQLAECQVAHESGALAISENLRLRATLAGICRAAKRSARMTG